MLNSVSKTSKNGYLGLSVDLRLVFQQEADHLYVAIVTGHMERSVTQLRTQKSFTRYDQQREDHPIASDSTGSIYYNLVLYFLVYYNFIHYMFYKTIIQYEEKEGITLISVRPEKIEH